MPQYIVKLERNDQTWYLEWCTISDSPATWGMSLEEFKDYYKGTYGMAGLRGLPERLTRADIMGVSAHFRRIESLIECNRAGHNEVNLTKDEIIDQYCINRPKGQALILKL